MAILSGWVSRFRAIATFLPGIALVVSAASFTTLAHGLDTIRWHVRNRRAHRVIIKSLDAFIVVVAIAEILPADDVLEHGPAILGEDDANENRISCVVRDLAA